MDDRDTAARLARREFEALVGAMPEPADSPRIVWTNDPRNRTRPVHDLTFVERLLSLPDDPQYRLLFLVEGDAPGTTFVQVARDGDRYIVDFCSREKTAMRTLSMRGVPRLQMTTLIAPWSAAEYIPCWDADVLDMTTAAACTWQIMTQHSYPGRTMLSAPSIPGPHRVGMSSSSSS